MSETRVERQRDLWRVADLFLRHLDWQNDGSFGLDGKRPFGFSGGVEGDILCAIGQEPDADGEFTWEQEDYARDLMSDLPRFLREQWERHPGRPEDSPDE